ncbi:MAG: PepSY-like domain-containing protein [Bacteroides sp.]|nr:PepSY-like domain-containing protein [Bacteroides sp.]
MKKVMTILVCLLALVACSDDDDHKLAVPERVTQAFHTKYPAATHVEWEMKGGYYVADCRMDGKEMDVWFGRQGDWVLTEIDEAWENLPPAVQTAFETGDYASWKREEYALLQYPLQPFVYVIEVEQGGSKVQLFYAEDGNLMKSLNVTGQDDTHWPIISF